MEQGDGVVCCSGERVVLDDTERTIMAARTDTDVSQAAAEPDNILRMSLDLHAYHSFSHAAAVDGSKAEDVVGNRRPRSRVAYGIYTGAPRRDKLHFALRGGRLHSDAQVADAEMFAIYSYLNDLDKELGPQVHTAHACSHNLIAWESWTR